MSATPVIYCCQPCATRNGWPLPIRDQADKRSCSICNRHAPVVKAHPHDLPTQVSTPYNVMLSQLLDACKEALDKAWHGRLTAAGEAAAYDDRIKALTEAGADMTSPLATDTTAESHRLHGEANKADQKWWEAFRKLGIVSGWIALEDQPPVRKKSTVVEMARDLDDLHPGWAETVPVSAMGDPNPVLHSTWTFWEKRESAMSDRFHQLLAESLYGVARQPVSASQSTTGQFQTVLGLWEEEIRKRRVRQTPDVGTPDSSPSAS